MRIFGFIIERVHGTRVGSLQDAIENAQFRLAKIENLLAVQRSKVSQAKAVQDEAEQVLSDTRVSEGLDGIWEGM